MIPREVLDTIEENRNRYLQELIEFLRIPSVSTYSHNAADVRRAAEWVLNQIKNLGFRTELMETEKHPVIFAERGKAGGRPTLLIYGHYDVQPPEPLDEWVTPPFSPDVRDGFVYARGASDDKGQFFTYIKALEAILSHTDELPVNVKFLVEGEEEIASPSLPSFLNKYKDLFSADLVTVSDGAQFAHGIPAITYGLRGLSYMQIDVTGPKFDLHSGSFGGLIENPAQALAGILARMKNADGTVAIPGFYDDVLDLEPWERQEMASLPYDEGSVKAYLGVNELRGEPGYTPLERRSARPTLDINGIWGGFAGEGSKTVIPAKAGAKVSMRLVPNQKDKRIGELFRKFVLSCAPSGVNVEVKQLHGADPLLVPRNLPEIRAAEQAIQTGFGRAPVFIREGGSIPIMNLFKDVLGLDTMLMLGWGSPDDGAHSPNERFSIADFQSGIRSAAALLYDLAR